MKKNPPIKNEYTHGEPTPYRTNPFKNDVLYTEEGQWKYPGQVTRIPSGDITMQGVPYPVLGVDNYGNQQMMQPGADYTFPGQYVTEYPQMASYGEDPSLPAITGHYPFGGMYTKTHTHMQDGGDYNMKRALELGYKPDKGGHWPTVDNQTGVFLKSRNHPTIQKELDWYNSPAGAIFKSQHDIDSSGTYFKYIPKNIDPGFYKQIPKHLENYNPDPGFEIKIKKDPNQAPHKTDPNRPGLSLYGTGGWLDELDEEYRRGGPVNPLMLSRSKRKKTSKNIQSSVNKMFLRNYDIFGPGGKNIYDPKSKYQEGSQVNEENKKFLTDMANSPLFAERYARMVAGYEEKNPDQYQAAKNSAGAYKDWLLNNINTIKYETNPKYLEKKSLLGEYQSLPKKGIHTIIQSGVIDPDTDLHELSHASTQGGTGMRSFYDTYTYIPATGYSSVYPEELKKNLSDPSDYAYFKKHMEKSYGTKKQKKYLSDPTEIKARIDVSRKLLKDAKLYDPINSEFEEKDYENLQKHAPKNSDVRDLLMNYPKNQVIQMMNNIVSNNLQSQPVAKMGGGWLDEMQEGASVIPKLRYKQDMADAYAAAADFKNSNRVSSTAVNKFIPSLTEEDIAAAEANKEFAKLPKAQQDAIIMQNQAMYSRGPEAQLSQGKKLTEEEQAYSDKVSRRIKYPFSDIGIAAGNVASYLGRFEGLSPEEIAASTNNPMGALSVSSDVASEAMINEMLGVGASKLFKKGVQRAYGLHKYPNLPDLGLKPLPNGAHDKSTVKSVKDAGLEQQMAQERAAELEALHARAFPFAEGVQQPTVKPFGSSLSAEEKAYNDVLAVNDWHNFDAKYKGANIAKSGHFNEGVFEIKGHPEYIAKVENPFRKDKHGNLSGDEALVGQGYSNINYPSLYKSIHNPNVGKVIAQIPHPEGGGKRILITKRVEGKPMSKLSPAQLKRIPKEAFIEADAIERNLRNNGLAVDFAGDNILYNTKEKKFKFIDLSPTPTSFSEVGTMEDHWADNIILGVDQALPKAQSARAIRQGLVSKYAESFERSIQKTAGLGDPKYLNNTFDIIKQMQKGPPSARALSYMEQAGKTANRKALEILRLLAKQPVDRMGGAWLDKLF